MLELQSESFDEEPSAYVCVFFFSSALLRVCALLCFWGVSKPCCWYAQSRVFAIHLLCSLQHWRIYDQWYLCWWASVRTWEPWKHQLPPLLQVVCSSGSSMKRVCDVVCNVFELLSATLFDPVPFSISLF